MTIGLQTILQLKNLTVKPQRFFCSSEIKFLFRGVLTIFCYSRVTCNSIEIIFLPRQRKVYYPENTLLFIVNSHFPLVILV